MIVEHVSFLDGAMWLHDTYSKTEPRFQLINGSDDCIVWLATAEAAKFVAAMGDNAEVIALPVPPVFQYVVEELEAAADSMHYADHGVAGGWPHRASECVGTYWGSN